MSDEELLTRVLALRSEGVPPKGIARALGIRPSQAASLVRDAAKSREPRASEPRLMGCWVSAGWSVGLTVERGHDWPDRPENGNEASGLVGVLLAREQRGDGASVSVCGYLVDAYCLGVKDALGPRRMTRGELHRFVDLFFTPFDGEPIAAPLELARQLVWGSVAYARELGFEPGSDFKAAASSLGPLVGAVGIGFGHNGKPSYMQGPYDDADRIMHTLRERLGDGNFHYTVAVPLGAG